MKSSWRRLIGIVALSCLVMAGTTGAAVAEELAFWCHWGPGQAAAITNVIIPQFKADTGVDVALTFARPMEEKLTLATAAGTAPDVVVVKYNNISALVEAGLIQPIDRFVASSTKIRKEYYDPATWNIGFYKGKMYAVPAIEVGPIGGLIFHRRLFAEAGLESRAPKTIDEMKAFHRKLTKIEADGRLTQIGFHPMMAGAADQFHMLYGIEWYDPKTGNVNFTSEETIRMIEDIHYYLQYAGLDNPGANRFPFGDWTGGFARAQTGMMFAGYYVVGELSRLQNTDEADYGYGWMPNPHNDKWIWPRGWTLAIPTGAKNPELGFKFIERFIDGDGPKAFWDTQGWLNGNLRFMSRLPVSRDSGIWFFIDSLTQADRLGSWPRFPEYQTVMGAWGTALWDIFTRAKTPMEALSNLERQFNNK